MGGSTGRIPVEIWASERWKTTGGHGGPEEARRKPGLLHITEEPLPTPGPGGAQGRDHREIGGSAPIGGNSRELPPSRRRSKTPQIPGLTGGYPARESGGPVRPRRRAGCHPSRRRAVQRQQLQEQKNLPVRAATRKPGEEARRASPGLLICVPALSRTGCRQMGTGRHSW